MPCLCFSLTAFLFVICLYQLVVLSISPYDRHLALFQLLFYVVVKLYTHFTGLYSINISYFYWYIFKTYTYVLIQHQKCHRNSQLGRNHVQCTIILYYYYHYTVLLCTSTTTILLQYCILEYLTIISLVSCTEIYRELEIVGKETGAVPNQLALSDVNHASGNRTTTSLYLSYSLFYCY